MTRVNYPALRVPVPTRTRDTSAVWCHSEQKLPGVSTPLCCSSLLFSPIWFTFIIYETCLTNPQQRFQIMIGICQCRIVFLKTITTVPGNVNMSIEGNTSLNKPIFCKNKTKSKAKKKKNHAGNGNLSSMELFSCKAQQKNSCFLPDGGDRKAQLCFPPIKNCQTFNILALHIRETPWERRWGSWEKSKSSCYSRSKTWQYNVEKTEPRINQVLEQFHPQPNGFNIWSQTNAFLQFCWSHPSTHLPFSPRQQEQRWRSNPCLQFIGFAFPPKHLLGS